MTAPAGPVTESELPAFEEGVHVHHRDGWFYLSFGHDVPQRVAYARSRSPEGPWTVEGLVNVCVDRLHHDGDGRIARVHMTTEGLRG